MRGFFLEGVLYETALLFFLSRVACQSPRNELADFGDFALGDELQRFGAVFRNGGVDAVPHHQREHGVVGERGLRHESGGQFPPPGVGQSLQRRGEFQLHKAGCVRLRHFYKPFQRGFGWRAGIIQQLDGPHADVFARVVRLLEQPFLFQAAGDV